MLATQGVWLLRAAASEADRVVTAANQLLANLLHTHQLHPLEQQIAITGGYSKLVSNLLKYVKRISFSITRWPWLVYRRLGNRANTRAPPHLPHLPHSQNSGSLTWDSFVHSIWVGGNLSAGTEAGPNSAYFPRFAAPDVAAALCTRCAF